MPVSPRGRSASAAPASSPAPSSRSSRTSRFSGGAHKGALVATTKSAHMRDVDFVNSGYARALLEEYLENPEAVPSEWRALFESGDGELLESLPGLARLLEQLRTDANGQTTAPAPAPPTAAPSAPPDDVLLGGVAAAMSLVK